MNGYYSERDLAVKMEQYQDRLRQAGRRRLIKAVAQPSHEPARRQFGPQIATLVDFIRRQPRLKPIGRTEI